MSPDDDKVVPPMNRGLSLAEFALGSFIVIGHNVFHIVPNEVPILFVLGSWKALGLQRPSSWTTTILFAIGAAATRIVLGTFVIDPLTAHFWPPQLAPAGSEHIAHNPVEALQWLLLVWTFAAFGEEIGYRGYLTKRAADIGRGSRWSWFGFGHYYKGPAGILDSTVAGLILGATYLLSKRNLWATILAHGLIDTFAIVTVFLGLDN
jgi:membrane protease YdiL (CAAX protease family)